MKRKNFKKRKKPVEFDAAVKAAVQHFFDLALLMAEFKRGRVNISRLLPDHVKARAYEAGFVGFNVQVPSIKPNPFIRENHREYVLMKGRRMGLTALQKQLYGPDSGPESEADYLKRFNHSAHEEESERMSVLRKRLEEIRAAHGEADPVRTDEARKISEAIKAPKADEAESVDANQIGGDPRPDSGAIGSVQTG